MMRGLLLPCLPFYTLFTSCLEAIEVLNELPPQFVVTGIVPGEEAVRTGSTIRAPAPRGLLFLWIFLSVDVGGSL